MNKHEWIKNQLINALDSYDDGTLKLQVIEYINEVVATEKLYEELKRDVKRYWELRDKGSSVFGSEESVEMYRLRQKLSKVDVKDEK